MSAVPRTYYTSTGQKVTTYYDLVPIPAVIPVGAIHPMQARMNLRPDSKVSVV
jgi:hypothetical protein